MSDLSGIAMPFKISRSIKNELFRQISTLELAPSDFSWRPRGENAERLVHSPTDSHIEFSLGQNNEFWVSWLPPSADGKRHGLFRGDEALLSAARHWLKRVKLDAEEPDLWAEVAREAEFISGEGTEGNRLFTTAEQSLLADRIDQLEKQIAVLTPLATADQRRHVHDRLEQAKEASSHVKRIDWKALFVGKLLDIITKLALEPEKARQVLHFATMYVGPLVAHVKGLIG